MVPGASVAAVAHLRHVLERLPDHPVNRVDELLPWAIAAELPTLRMAA